MRLGFGEILVVLAIAFLLFGPGKLPQLGDALGKGIRNFKKAVAGNDPEEANRPEQPKLTGGSPGVPGTTATAATPAETGAKKA